MSTDRDMARIVRSWLRTDEHESADRVLEHVLAALDATPQRRPLWPTRRIADMNALARLAVAVAVVVVVAVAGYNFLPSRSGVGGGPASPSPSASPTSQPSPLATPNAFPPAGELTTSRQFMTLNGVSFSFHVPTAGWVSDGSFDIHKDNGVAPEGAGFIFWTETPIGVFADPCASVKGPPIGSSAVDLATAVAAVTGTNLVSGPSDVTVGGHPAKRVVLTVPDTAGCNAESFYLWYAAPADLARYATALGSTISVWIIDVGGTLVWIDGETYKGAGPEPGLEIQQVIDSIQFE